MNVTNYLPLKTFLNYTPLIRSKFTLLNSLLPCVNAHQQTKQPESRHFLWTSSVCLAGHSKWSNIKNIKAANDRQKNLITSKYALLLKNACREGGSADPICNATLAKVIIEAKRHQIPAANIERALKNFQKARLNGKPAILAYGGLGGVLILLDVHTDNINRTRTSVQSVIKKSGFKEMPRNQVEVSFEERGIIMAKGDIDKAVDDAIEVGAEDVTEEEDCLTFVCSATDFYSVKKGIEERNYEIEYSDVDRIPLMQVPVNDLDVDKYRELFDKLEELEDIVKVSRNINV